tara:strand:+ start:438 stop:1166 length:729 start_codon:yes stop_codon:yes gene_type:complete
MDWKPNEDELEMTKNELEGLPPNGVWATPNNHAEYRRDGDDNRLILIRRLDHPAVEEAHRRITLAGSMVGWEVVETEETELIPAWHPSPEDAMLEERKRKQESLMTATCANAECDAYISAMDLENAKWTHIEDTTYFDEEKGVEEAIEIWSPIVDCYLCDTSIPLAPEHYLILVGDDLASILKLSSGRTYTVLKREEVIAMVDERELEGLHILGTFCPYSNEAIPPHYRGLMVKSIMIGEEE